MGKEQSNKLEGKIQFCQQPSNKYLDLIEDADGDPRSAAGIVAMRDLERQGGWAPTVDARDARVSTRGDFYKRPQEK